MGWLEGESRLVHSLERMRDPRVVSDDEEEEEVEEEGKPRIKSGGCLVLLLRLEVMYPLHVELAMHAMRANMPLY